jgi:hypothetical protein
MGWVCFGRPGLFLFSSGQPMKQILITADTVCGGIAVSAGDVIDASDRDANVLVAIGKAQPFERAESDLEAPRRGRPRKAAE